MVLGCSTDKQLCADPDGFWTPSCCAPSACKMRPGHPLLGLASLAELWLWEEGQVKSWKETENEFQLEAPHPQQLCRVG